MQPARTARDPGYDGPPFIWNEEKRRRDKAAFGNARTQTMTLATGVAVWATMSTLPAWPQARPSHRQMQQFVVFADDFPRVSLTSKIWTASDGV